MNNTALQQFCRQSKAECLVLVTMTRGKHTGTSLVDAKINQQYS